MTCEGPPRPSDTVSCCVGILRRNRRIQKPGGVSLVTCREYARGACTSNQRSCRSWLVRAGRSWPHRLSVCSLKSLLPPLLCTMLPAGHAAAPPGGHASNSEHHTSDESEPLLRGSVAAASSAAASSLPHALPPPVPPAHSFGFGQPPAFGANATPPGGQAPPPPSFAAASTPLSAAATNLHLAQQARAVYEGAQPAAPVQPASAPSYTEGRSSFGSACQSQAFDPAVLARLAPSPAACAGSSAAQGAAPPNTVEVTDPFTRGTGSLLTHEERARLGYAARRQSEPTMYDHGVAAPASADGAGSSAAHASSSNVPLNPPSSVERAFATGRTPPTDFTSTEGGESGEARSAHEVAAAAAIEAAWHAARLASAPPVPPTPTAPQPTL